MGAKMEFRDGDKYVPDHVRDMLSGLDTHRFTYEEAMKIAQTKLTQDHLGQAQAGIIQRHFRDNQ